MTNRADHPRLIKMSKLAKLAGVPAPTIKHYIREGLLPGPARRTSRNMAYYDARLADRVRAIKALQQQSFLPLKLIGEILEPAPSAKVRADLDEATRARLGAVATSIRAGHTSTVERRSARAHGLTRAEVMSRFGVTQRDLSLLESLGVLPAAGGRGAEEITYRGPALDLLETIAETRRRGLGDVFPMEILEPYTEAVRALVRVELDLFRQRVLEGPGFDDGQVAEMASVATALAERLLLALRGQLLIVETDAVAGAWNDTGDE